MTDQQLFLEPDARVAERGVPRSAHIAAWLALVVFAVALALMAWGASSG